MKKIELDKIRKIVSQKPVVLAFLFGSFATKFQNRLSDFDIAVLLAQSVPKSRYFSIRRSLINQLDQLTKPYPVDVVIINQASPLLVQLIATQGKLIFSKSRKIRVAFQTEAIKKFDEALYLKKVYYHYLHQRVNQNKLGERYA